jgi:uncharacterized membrane protein
MGITGRPILLVDLKPFSGTFAGMMYNYCLSILHLVIKVNYHNKYIAARYDKIYCQSLQRNIAGPRDNCDHKNIGRPARKPKYTNKTACTQFKHRILRTILLIYGKTISIMSYTIKLDNTMGVSVYIFASHFVYKTRYSL